jgi:hypothetical protein
MEVRGSRGGWHVRSRRGDLWLLNANLRREAIEMQWESEGVDKYFFAVFEVLSSCI